MRQIVECFISGIDWRSGEYDTTPLEVQINNYLEEHPGYSAKSINTIVGPSYKEAFVIFDIRDEEKKDHYNNKRDKEIKNDRK